MPEFYRLLDGTLAAYSEYGMYPVFYIDSDANILCAHCADKIDVSDIVSLVSCKANWENTELDCDDCGKRIESAYGED